MFRPTTTLKLRQEQIVALRNNGVNFVEDLVNDKELLGKFGGEEQILRIPKTVSALDILQEESQTDILSTSSSALDYILNGGFRCGTITEISGRTGTGKTQICFQACVNVQLPRSAGGLEGKAIYIDTKNGFSALRIQGKVDDLEKKSAIQICNEEV